VEVVLAVLAPITYVAMLGLERVFPAQALPRVRGWLAKGVLFFVLGTTTTAALAVLAARAFATPLLVDTRGIGSIASGLLGFVVADFIAYGVHRLLHVMPFLWRWVHQMHHSAERLDVAGASYCHPFDLMLHGGANVAAIVLFGLSIEAAALTSYLGFFSMTFQHMNVKTPRWIGFVLQRPEAHAVHHARGVHAYNYGKLMIWDIVFRTFRNPIDFTYPLGFWEGASAKVSAMLVGRDVADP
jgi:sterol desaturase/sphingolipid hydroxylase (fatty acid hydroxylase superfamily)